MRQSKILSAKIGVGVAFQSLMDEPCSYTCHSLQALGHSHGTAMTLYGNVKIAAGGTLLQDCSRGLDSLAAAMRCSHPWGKNGRFTTRHPARCDDRSRFE